MSTETEKRDSINRLEEAIMAGDADAVFLHAADVGLSTEDFLEAAAKIALVKSKEYEDAAKKVGSGRAEGVEHNGKWINLIWDNSFEKKRAENLRRLAKILSGRLKKS